MLLILLNINNVINIIIIQINNIINLNNNAINIIKYY